MDPICDFLPVYMFRDDVERIIKERNNMFPFTNVQSSAPTSSSPFGPSPPQTKSPIEEEEEDADGFRSLGLCTVSVRDFSIALLMTFQAFSNKQHINRSIWKMPADQQFQALENDLEAENNPTIPTPNTPTANPGRPILIPTAPSLQNNARVVPTSNYNFLAYDSMTYSASGSSITTPQEQDFVQAASNIHNSFLQDPAISEFIRKDHTGEIYGKHVFGREVFYQLKNSNNMSHDKFLEVIEKIVRGSLKDEHNINVI